MATQTELITAANIAYHEAEAKLYDASHPEIEKERTSWNLFAQRFMQNSADRPPMKILDVGCGTGFVATVLHPFLKTGDTYIGSDICPDMLERVPKMARGAEIRTVVMPADRLAFDDNSFDIVVVNSALHHFPNVDAALNEMKRVGKPGGILAILHEPNIRFSKSFFLRQVARFASVLAARVDKSHTDRVRPNYGPVFEHVNNRLIAEGLIDKPLAQKEVQALVDVHSPTARGIFEERGFDPFEWIKTTFCGWPVESVATYNFLGKLDPTIWWRSCLNRLIASFFPKNGSLFSLVVRKPRSDQGVLTG